MGLVQSRTEKEASVSDVFQRSVFETPVMIEKDFSRLARSAHLMQDRECLPNFRCCPSLLITIAFSKTRRYGRVTGLKDLVRIFCRYQLHSGNVFQGACLE